MRTIAVLAVLCLLAGCYRRVVDADGVGTNTVETKEANLEPEPEQDDDLPDGGD
ncbi:MAG: hypothetical protein ACF8LL_09315 [Phycisphaerales bacterium]